MAWMRLNVRLKTASSVYLPSDRTFRLEDVESVDHLAKGGGVVVRLRSGAEFLVGDGDAARLMRLLEIPGDGAKVPGPAEV